MIPVYPLLLQSLLPFLDPTAEVNQLHKLFKAELLLCIYGVGHRGVSLFPGHDPAEAATINLEQQMGQTDTPPAKSSQLQSCLLFAEGEWGDGEQHC